MALAPHTEANKTFFEKGCAPSVGDWRDWISRGVVKGKLIDGKPFIDLNWFAAHDTMEGLPERDGDTVTQAALKLIS